MSARAAVALADLTEALEALAPGLAELASRLTGVTSKTIRNTLSAQPHRRCRWQVRLPGVGRCAHRLRWPCGRYAGPARVTVVGEMLLAGWD